MKIEVEACDECEDTEKDIQIQCNFCKKQLCEECQKDNIMKIINEKNKVMNVCSDCIQEWYNKKIS